MSYSREQLEVIRLGRALSAGYGRKVRMALFEALGVESNFRNLNYGDRDSRGVLQQRPSQGWGSPGNAAQDIRQFLVRAQRAAPNYRTAGELAQAVQRSAFPGRYDQHRAEAASLLGGAVSRSPVSGVSGAAGAAPSPGAATTRARASVLSSLVAASNQQNPSYGGLFAALHKLGAASRPPAAPAPPGASASPDATRPPGGGIVELFYDPLGAIKNGREIAPVGGHGDHVHVALANSREEVQAIQKARELGLRVGENPFVGRVNPVHVQGSYHYRTFPGRVNGRHVGEAADVSGDPARMAAFFRWVRRTYG